MKLRFVYDISTTENEIIQDIRQTFLITYEFCSFDTMWLIIELIAALYLFLVDVYLWYNY